MKIEDIDPQSIEWKRSIMSINAPMYEKVMKMALEGVIKIELDEPRKFFASAITSHFKRHDVDFSIRMMRKDKDGKIWLLKKTKKRSKRKNSTLTK